jgi:hypothetical protein
MKQNPSPGHKKHLQMTRAFRSEIEQAIIRDQLQALRVEQEKRELDSLFKLKAMDDDQHY